MENDPPQRPTGDDRPAEPHRTDAARTERAAREQREAAALRENLLRRKAHQRARPGLTRPDPTE